MALSSFYQILGIFWNTGTDYAMYLMVFFIASFVAIAVIEFTKKPVAGVVAFFGTLFTASLIGAFPVWVLAFPLVIIIMVLNFAKREE